MWFDSSSIANLAKSALKEGLYLETIKNIAPRNNFESIPWNTAQKHIDNVLDISNEDENVELTADDRNNTRSKTLSSNQDAGKNDLQDLAWGSFDGSFFEQRVSPIIPITNPPPKNTDSSSGAYQSPHVISFLKKCHFRLFASFKSIEFNSTITKWYRQ